MNKIFLSYDLSIIAKDLNFLDFCFGWYLIDDGQLTIENTNKQEIKKNLNLIVLAPTYQQIINWLRDTHNIHITIKPDKTSDFPKVFYKVIVQRNTDYEYALVTNCTQDSNDEILKTFFDYYEALNVGIKEGFKIVKQIK